ncbi:hypothetical protein F5Y01DRAFT_318901 [Xylaria sp. FL0043]|nr:hypothetical protein F5Y01DRAFT_318901 [Xylaria sp. FL0043]
MKVLITGASGSIGGECLAHCLSHPDISTVVAFVRRDLPADVSNHQKLKAIGSYNGSRTADLEYPMAFLESMTRILETRPARPRFKYVHLGGMFTSHDQEKKLCFLEYARKIRGLGEASALKFGESNGDKWKILVVRPGGVATETMMGSRTVASILGGNWCVRIEELGAFMTHLAINGEEEGPVIENAHIVRKGRELLKPQ